MIFRLLILGALCLVGESLSAQNGDDWKKGFIDFQWNPGEGTIVLDVSGVIEQEVLYASSLSAGLGSNDIGLDRNQLGPQRVVRFIRSGNKVLLVEENYQYRADSENPLEIQAVKEAFARSVIWGFTIEKNDNNSREVIDITGFLLRDAHGVGLRLEGAGEGSYSVDESRSAVNMDRTRNFPENTEFDAFVTFTGKPKGKHLPTVAPDPTSFTVQMHHSFIRLPEAGYESREYDPRSGYFTLSHYDYATPVSEPLQKRQIVRHRLEKKDPGAAMSEAVEPIIYYLDPGCPEPIRSALIEGASWWNEAFEAAGYRNAFQVRELPEGADPMDVRYNVINWVHRSTRGWSYGTSIVDPRTGEILKGHVLLGSLRVRQDYLIAQGLASIFEEGDESPDPLIDLALARLRQLSAHEVGHTLGLTHNFAASVNERASVMDYPHPYVTMGADGKPDFSQAYDTGIGEWDKRAIMYGYQDFPEGTDEDQALEQIIGETLESGLLFISDNDARPAGGGHPYAHLWDNGTNAVDELKRLSDVREYALANFGEKTIRPGREMSYLEDVLVPVYFAHRYQVEAVSKIIGGVNYTYNVRGDGQTGPMVIDSEFQWDAVEGLLNTLQPGFLALDEHILDLIPPKPEGFVRSRENFNSFTGPYFDPLAVAEASANHTLTFMLYPERLARLLNQSIIHGNPLGLNEYLDYIIAAVNGEKEGMEESYLAELSRMVQKRLVENLIYVVKDPDGQQQVNALVLRHLVELQDHYQRLQESDKGPEISAHAFYLASRIRQYLEEPGNFKPAERVEMPPGSPIGCGGPW